jgi:hypothetical protein
MFVFPGCSFNKIKIKIVIQIRKGKLEQIHILDEIKENG